MNTEEKVTLPVKMIVNSLRLQCEADVEAIGTRDYKTGGVDITTATYFAGFAAALRMLGHEVLADEIGDAASAEHLA